MKSLRIVASELWYQQLAYWRNPMGAFFTFFMPVMFLVIFASLYSGDRYQGLKLDQYFIPGIMTFGVISACYTNLSVTLANQREQGILKRFRGTPLPPWAYMVATVASCVIRALVLVALTLGVGVAFYGLVVPAHSYGAIAAIVVLGAATFCALGVAITVIIPNADAAPAIVNGVYLPLMFISGTFFPLSSSSVLAKIASYFPIRPFVLASYNAMNPRVHTDLIHAIWLENLAIWCVVAFVFAVRRFSWLPRRRS
ncbi:MAG: ABC transporter permease [Acidimicrobiales bacterium]